MLGSHADLWLGDTQQSRGQVYSGEISRPFRETNCKPEVFTTIPVALSFLGLTGRMVNLGLDRGPSCLLIRPWIRIDDAAEDDNPDISSYVGRGDIPGIWSKGNQTDSLMLRSSFQDDWHRAGKLD